MHLRIGELLDFATAASGFIKFSYLNGYHKDLSQMFRFFADHVEFKFVAFSVETKSPERFATRGSVDPVRYVSGVRVCGPSGLPRYGYLVWGF